MKSPSELKQKLLEASRLVKIGDRYFHYKDSSKTYVIKDLAIIEATEEVGVVYAPEYEELSGVCFVRPIDNFLSSLVVNGVEVPRFAKQ